MIKEWESHNKKKKKNKDWNVEILIKVLECVIGCGKINMIEEK